MLPCAVHLRPVAAERKFVGRKRGAAGSWIGELCRSSILPRVQKTCRRSCIEPRWSLGRHIAHFLRRRICTKGRRRSLVTGNQRVGSKDPRPSPKPSVHSFGEGLGTWTHICLNPERRSAGFTPTLWGGAAVVEPGLWCDFLSSQQRRTGTRRSPLHTIRRGLGAAQGQRVPLNRSGHG